MILQSLFGKMGLDLYAEPSLTPICEEKKEVFELPIRSPYVVSQRVVLCGSFLEHYEYKSPYIKGMPRVWQPVAYKHTPKPQESMLDHNVKRTRTRIRRLVNCNSDLNRFLTLTFADNVDSLEYANNCFDVFIKRVRRAYPKFKYICVPEFQKRGAVHYHLLCNLDYVDVNDFRDTFWQHGFIRLNKINNVDNVGAYVCKYLGKENFDSRFFKKKKFFYSKNLLVPLIVDKLEEVLNLLAFFDLKSLKKRFELTIDTEYFGEVKYSQYKINNIINFNQLKVACT